MYFFTFLLKNLLRRPARSLLTIVGLSVAVGAVVALVGVATGFENDFLNVYQSRDLDIVVQRAGSSAEAQNRGLPESDEAKIAAVKGVRLVMSGLVDFIDFDKNGLVKGTINGWKPDCPFFETLKITSGRKLTAEDKHPIMLGHILAANLGKKVGDTLTLYGEHVTFTVVGIYESKVIFENGGAITLLNDLQDVTNRTGEVSGFPVTAEKPIDKAGIEELCRRINEISPTLSAKPSSSFVKGVQQIKVSHAVAWSISAIALVIGAIGMLNTMIMSVFERTKEIGTLRAIGWRRSRIMRMVIGESVLLSIAGAIVGSLVALLLVKLLTQLPIAAGFVHGNIDPPVIAQGFLVAVLVGVLGAIYPAMWSANLLPTEALRRNK
jgi:putative ABC transport system permease protein